MYGLNVNIFKQFSFFREFDDLTLQSLAEKSIVRTFRKNTIVILEEEEPRSVYFILEGAVRVFRENAIGKEITLNELARGDYFGELAQLSRTNRSASVITKEFSKMIVIPVKEFEKLYLEYPQLLQAITLKFASQISSLSQHLQAVALDDIQKRVMWALQSYAVLNERNTLVSTATHKEIANYIGSSRESVSRAIQDLKASGHVKQIGKNICLGDLIA